MSSNRARHLGDNLPAETTSFVGRRREISEAKRLLSTSRLLTLTGIGGVGKTRLAVRVAAGVRRAFADGVWLVELAALQDRSLLEQTVADTVGLRERSARQPREVLVGHLRDKQLLLVLDNCEHLVDHCAGLAADLLAAAPDLRILATSRHALASSGEQILAVLPLPVPDPEHLPQAGTLPHADAIRLFAERAAPVRPGFAVTADNQGTLARICRRFSGDLPRALAMLEDALTRFEALGELTATVILTYATLAGGVVAQGDLARAVALGQQSLAICEQHGERWARAYALASLVLAEWHQGEIARASEHAREGLRVMHAFNDVFGTVILAERLAWITGMAGQHEQATVLLGVASTLWPLIGGQPLFGSRQYLAAHETCEQQARTALGEPAFRAAYARGADLDLDQAIAYALGKESAPATPTTTTDTVGTPLTRRERQVAELIAEGLSNKDIATRLMIAKRTAECHVEHILTKLGFTTRTRLAAWIVSQRETGNDEHKEQRSR